MSTVKINCPKCGATGITGSVTESVCSQCLGKGTISVQDTDTILTVSTAAASAGKPLIVTAPTPAPAAAVKRLSRENN